MSNDRKNTSIQSTNDTNWARLMMIVSMAIFGTIGLFVRNISVSSGELALYRAVLGEPLTVVQALGGALILGFTAWNELGGKKA